MAGVSLGKYFWKRENHSVFVLETFLIIIPPTMTVQLQLRIIQRHSK